jgi:hypothetical protein
VHAGVGDVVGEGVGFGVGEGVGEGVGFGVGVKVGLGVGLTVGLGVGFGVGAAVGIATHSVSPSASAVHVVAAQSWHSWYFFFSWYLPVGQWKQLVWPVQAAYLPVSQSLHSCDVDGWYWPIAQLLQLGEPATANLPSPQVLQDGALYLLVYLPIGQIGQPKWSVNASIASSDMSL